jgi:uncharacterized membrane protein
MLFNKKSISGNLNLFTDKSNIYITLIIAAIVAATGFLDNSAIPIMGSMLISPLLTPLYYYLVGHLSNKSGILFSNLFLLLKLVIISILIGFISMTIYILNTGNLLETSEMYSRTTYQHIYSNAIIALICGGLNIVSIINNSIISKVGIGLSLTLLPPLVNTGLYLANMLFLKYSKKDYNLIINKTDLEEISLSNDNYNDNKNNKNNNENKSINSKEKNINHSIEKFEKINSNNNNKKPGIKDFLIKKFKERAIKSAILTLINIVFILLASYIVLYSLKYMKLL